MTVLKGEDSYKEELEIDFNYQWIFNTVKAIILGIGTTTKLRVSPQDAMITFLLLKISTRSKQRLPHLFQIDSTESSFSWDRKIFVSETMINMKLKNANEKKIQKEAEAFKSVRFFVRTEKKLQKAAGLSENVGI